MCIRDRYNMLQPTFPNVRYMDARGTLGRTKATRSTTRLYWSAPSGELTGTNPDYLLQAVVDAKYMINFSILKSHERNGITVAAKNHYGSLSGGNDDVRKPTTANYYNIHLRLPLETASGAWAQRASMGQYRPLVDLNGPIDYTRKHAASKPSFVRRSARVALVLDFSPAGRYNAPDFT